MLRVGLLHARLRRVSRLLLLLPVLIAGGELRRLLRWARAGHPLLLLLRRHRLLRVHATVSLLLLLLIRRVLLLLLLLRVALLRHAVWRPRHVLLRIHGRVLRSTLATDVRNVGTHEIAKGKDCVFGVDKGNSAVRSAGLRENSSSLDLTRPYILDRAVR